MAKIKIARGISYNRPYTDKVTGEAKTLTVVSYVLPLDAVKHLAKVTPAIAEVKDATGAVITPATSETIDYSAIKNTIFPDGYHLDMPDNQFGDAMSIEIEASQVTIGKTGYLNVYAKSKEAIIADQVKRQVEANKSAELAKAFGVDEGAVAMMLSDKLTDTQKGMLLNYKANTTSKSRAQKQAEQQTAPSELMQDY